MMFAPLRRSFTLKFVAAVMATTFIAVLVSGMANLAYDIHDFQSEVVADLTTQAKILGQINIAALEFDDRRSAQVTLNELRSRPAVLAAAIYRSDGRLFSAYVSDKAGGADGAAATAGAPGVHMAGNEVRVIQRITRGAEDIGAIDMRATYPMAERISRNIRMLAAVIIASLLVAAVVSLWLQAAVTRPVREMTASVRRLIASRDFTKRVTRTTDDEIGLLVDAFNTMLSELGNHSALLERTNGVLQKEVAERIKADQALQELNGVLEQRIVERSLALERANEQLRQAQKMEAIGQLTGGVAHDFNNVLQVISGNLQLLAMALPADQKAQQRIRTAKSATERGAKLSSQLLAFARKQPLRPAPTDLSAVLGNMEDMFRRALGEGIEIRTFAEAGLWTTLVDPYQIENVILNLAINARDAMKGHGRLTIEAANVTLDDSYVAQAAEVEAGSYVMLVISDTGCGMPPAVIERAFEPFFTTKPEGQGTGLGLSMAFGFVKQSRGHIKIYSEVDVGTSIKIYLPRSQGAAEKPVDPTAGEIVGGSETILVVEDDQAVRLTVVDTLRGLGYHVLSANDGEAGLAVLEQGTAVDMLFTDVVMPGPVKSTELARRARQLLPRIAVLFTSGYTQNAIVHGGRLDAGVELISKPYQRADLARKIRQVFAQPTRADA
jgi:signal transduction histidine kinase